MSFVCIMVLASDTEIINIQSGGPQAPRHVLGRARAEHHQSAVARADQRRDLLEIVEERYGRKSLLMTSQVPASDWHAIIGNPTLGNAILDRIVHNAYRIELSGDSLRKHKAEAEPK
jgi:hypothetical protein